jgi:hypothetical protein
MINLTKHPTIKLHENPLPGSQVVTCRKKDGEMLKATTCIFTMFHVNAPSNFSKVPHNQI